MKVRKTAKGNYKLTLRPFERQVLIAALEDFQTHLYGTNGIPKTSISSAILEALRAARK